MNNKLMHRIKIAASLFLALITVSIGGPNLFIAGTTTIRSDFIAKIQTNPLPFLSWGTGSSVNSNQEEENNTNGGNSGNPAEGVKEENLTNTHPDKINLDYKPIGRGIYAAEDPATKKRYIKIDKGTKLEKKIVNINGRDVIIYVPAQ